MTLSEELNPAQSNAEFQRLMEAFDVFNKASASLQESYQELQVEAHRLSVELASTNVELQRSLAEKESIENYLKNILESLSNGVLVVDCDDRVTICNPSAISLLELTRGSLHSRKSYQDLPIPQELKDLIARALHSNQDAAEDLELQLVRDPRPQRFLAISNSRVTDQHGKCSGVTIILKDITRLKELEVQTHRAQRLRAMGEMAVQLAHEIRNPLGSIELFASLLGNELQPNAELRGWAEQIITGVKFLNTIVSNMLAFTRSSKPQFKEFDLLELVQATLAFIQPIFQQRDILVEKPALAEPLAIEGDPEMLRQMLMNLFMNALQAMPERGRLSVSLKISERHSAEIEVEDTGMGIPAENVNRIFDPFFTTNENGTGLGLFLVHQIVEKHHGRVTAQSEFGKGTRFTVCLPLKVKELVHVE